jgi:hypothetical protein
MVNLASDVWRDARGVVLVCVENALPPSDAEWARYTEQTVACLELANPSALVITDGGGPNAAQRKLVGSVFESQYAPCAVISDSVIVRGIVKALTWVNEEIAVFSPAAIHQALLYINIKDDRARAVWELARALNLRLDPAGTTVHKADPYLRW